MYRYQVSNRVEKPRSGCDLSERWAQLWFIDVHNRKHLFTNVCRPKHAQNFCSKGCHFAVACIRICIILEVRTACQYQHRIFNVWHWWPLRHFEKPQLFYRNTELPQSEVSVLQPGVNLPLRVNFIFQEYIISSSKGVYILNHKYQPMQTFINHSKPVFPNLFLASAPFSDKQISITPLPCLAHISTQLFRFVYLVCLKMI